MRVYLMTLCRLAPYVALALLGIFGLIDTTIMIVIAVTLITASRTGSSCLAPRKA